MVDEAFWYTSLRFIRIAKKGRGYIVQALHTMVTLWLAGTACYSVCNSGTIYDQNRTRTCNLWCRKPTRYHCAIWPYRNQYAHKYNKPIWSFKDIQGNLYRPRLCVNRLDSDIHHQQKGGADRGPRFLGTNRSTNLEGGGRGGGALGHSGSLLPSTRPSDTILFRLIGVFCFLFMYIARAAGRLNFLIYISFGLEPNIIPASTTILPPSSLAAKQLFGQN